MCQCPYLVITVKTLMFLAKQRKNTIDEEKFSLFDRFLMFVPLMDRTVMMVQMSFVILLVFLPLSKEGIP